MIDLISEWVNIPAWDARFASIIGIALHWAILQYALGMPLFAVLFEILSRKTGSKEYERMAKTFSKIMVILFPVGAVTGTLVEFGLVLVWPNLIVLVGKYFFSPLYLEIFAFLAEAIFFYMYYYTWDKVNPTFHILIGIFATLGGAISALMIVSVNTLMNIPPGLNIHYDPITGNWSPPTFTIYNPMVRDWVTVDYRTVRKLLTNDPDTFNKIMKATVEQVGIMGIVFGLPGVIPSFLHAIFAAYTVTGFTIVGGYAYRYITARNEGEKNFYLSGLKLIVLLSLIIILIQGLVIGHELGVTVAKYNPEKLAAMEGTSSKITSIADILGLSWIVKILAYGNPNAKLPNWDAIPKEFQSPLIIHYIYYTKLSLAILLGLDALLLVLFWYVLRREVPDMLLKLNILAPFIAQLASMFGWATREIGRKPFTVYGILKVNEAVTPTGVPTWIFYALSAYVLIIGFGTLGIVLYILRRRN